MSKLIVSSRGVKMIGGALNLNLEFIEGEPIEVSDEVAEELLKFPDFKIIKKDGD